MPKTKKPLDKDQICEQVNTLSAQDQIYVKSFIDKTLIQKEEAAQKEIALIKQKS